MDEDKAFPSVPLEDWINEINSIFDSEKPLTIVGRLTFNDGQYQFHEIKISWWRKLLAKIELKLSGWMFRLVGYDEFRRIVDDTSEGHSADPRSRR